MLKCIFMVLKPTQHFFVHGRTVVLKTASLLGNDTWTIGCTWLPEMSKYSPAVIRPLRVVTGPAEYQDTSAQIITDPPPCFTVGTRHSRLEASLGVWPGVGINMKDDATEHILYFQIIRHPGFIVISPTFFAF
jgi:hypothetical protein